MTSIGQPAVMDARCSHLSADLGRGKIVGDCIRCPFHHWEYGSDGACRHIPAEEHIPAFARQTTYPVAMRHGLLFFFDGRRAAVSVAIFLRLPTRKNLSPERRLIRGQSSLVHGNRQRV